MDPETEYPDPDPGIALSIRMPLTLAPELRHVGGVVVMAWTIDNGKLLFVRRVDVDRLEGGGSLAGVLISERMDRHHDGVFVCAYDGDDGQLMHTFVVRPGELVDQTGDGAPLAAMGVILDKAHADPDKPCALCDEDVPEGADIDATNVHRECLLANVIGPLGHHLDHSLWCDNIGDPHAGLGARAGNIKVAELVDRYGLEAVAKGEFPKDEASP